MDHAFQKIFCLLNALFNWTEDDSLLDNLLWQIWEVVEDIESTYEKKISRINELESLLENTEEAAPIKEEMQLRLDQLEQKMKRVEAKIDQKPKGNYYRKRLVGKKDHLREEIRFLSSLLN